MKIEQNSYVILKFNAILEVLTIYANNFNCTDMQIMYFILDKILKLDLLHAFLSLVVANYLISKTLRFFWPTLYNIVVLFWPPALGEYRVCVCLCVCVYNYTVHIPVSTTFNQIILWSLPQLPLRMVDIVYRRDGTSGV